MNDGLAFVLNENEVEGEGEGDVEGGGKGKGKAAEGAKKVAAEASGEKTRAALAWVQSVLDLKDKFDRMLAEAFNSDKEFEKSINEVSLFFPLVLRQMANMMRYRHLRSSSTRI